MKATPTKFQAMLLGRDFKQMTVNVEGNTTEMISSVKLLGIQTDNKLTFNKHISKLCEKSVNQINVMKRLGDISIMTARYTIVSFNQIPIIAL